MKLTEQLVKDSLVVFGYISKREKPVYHSEITGNLRTRFSEKIDRRISDSLNLLERLNLIKEIGEDAYALR